MTPETRTAYRTWFKTAAAQRNTTIDKLEGQYATFTEADGVIIVPVQCFLCALIIRNTADLVSDVDQIVGG